MKSTKPDIRLISVVVPVWNERESLPQLYKELSELKRSVVKSRNCEFEYLFVDDGSSDDSVKILNGYTATDPAVKVVELSRNFGKEIAVTAGIHASKGDAIIMIDADLQHPIGLIPEFIDRWDAGAEVVIGVRSKYDAKEPVWKRATSSLFYTLLSKISSTEVVPHATDFRLIDRQVADAFAAMPERRRMTRALIDWLGFRRDYIYFTAPVRQYGTASYSFRNLVRLAIDGFVSNSLFPLKLAGYVGIGISVLSGLAGLFIVIEDFLLADPLGLNFSGPAMLAVLNMFLIGIVLSALGLVSLYIATIHTEVLGRPLYVTRRPSAGKQQNNH